MRPSYLDPIFGLQDLADVEKRAQAAENRHQELSAKLPEATAPLLRQISALQDASSAQVGRNPTGGNSAVM
jgi:hypothetical protein